MKERMEQTDQSADGQRESQALDAATIRQQLEDLERMQRWLNVLLTKVEGRSREREIVESAVNFGTNGSATWKRPEPHPGAAQHRPMRSVLLDALQDLGWPAYSRELALYCEARYGRKIPVTRFGTLAVDEEKAYYRPTRRPRAVWLCFALTSDRHLPIRRLWARSDWPLSKRIVAPTTGRIQHLWMTRKLCDLALELGETAADPEMLRILAADHARDLLGVPFRRGKFDLTEWRDMAEAQLAELLPEDERLREESAERLARLPEWVQLFGAPDVIGGGKSESQAKRGGA